LLVSQIFSEGLRLCSYYKGRHYFTIPSKSVLNVSILLHSSYLTMTLTEDRLDALIRWYDKTVYTTGLDDQYFHDNGLIEQVYNMIGTATLTKGFVLSRKAREIVKRREPLRLTLELMARLSGSLSVADMADIVKRIPFTELPELLACDDEYIRELAERKLRKRRFLASMR